MHTYQTHYSFPIPAISWYVDVMIKSAWFMATRSARNWQLKW